MMGVWYRIFTFVLCLASVEAQAQMAPVIRSGDEVQCPSVEGYDRDSQMDDARLLMSFAAGFLVMHKARKRLKKREGEADPDGFGNFDFLEDETPLCQMEPVDILKFGL